MARYKVGDRVKLDAEYLKPYTGTVTQVQTFKDGSPTEYGVQLDGGRLGYGWLAQELTEENQDVDRDE